jgi:hypothetical protein
MEQSTRKIVIVIVCLIVAAIMIYIVWTHMPNVVTNILYPERAKLARYVACSLALCTKGCNDPMLLDPTNPISNGGFICLENNSETHECDLPCKKFCEDWNNPPHACGPNYYINLTLQGGGPFGGVPFKGLYEVKWMPSTQLGLSYCLRLTDLRDLIFYMQDKDYPNFPDPNKIVSNDDLFGAIYDTGDDWTGNGAIFLEQEVARTNYGCFKQSPFSGIGSSNFCGGNVGYYQCQFQGDLHIWTVHSTSNSESADVRINSSKSGTDRNKNKTQQTRNLCYHNIK